MNEYIPRIDEPNTYPDPYVELASRDPELMGLIEEQAAMEYNEGRLHQEFVDKQWVSKLPAEYTWKHDEIVNKAKERENVLFDVWRESGRDPRSFRLLLAMRDWQHKAEVETDSVDRNRALRQYRSARAEYDAYIYGIDYRGGNLN